MLVIMNGLIRNLFSANHVRRLFLSLSKSRISGPSSLSPSSGKLFFQCRTEDLHLLHRTYCTSLAVSCWKCGSKIANLDNFCPECKVIQPLAENATYFNILGIQEDFCINESSLIQKFRKLQGVYHPDRYSQKSQVAIHIARVIVHNFYFYCLGCVTMSHLESKE